MNETKFITRVKKSPNWKVLVNQDGSVKKETQLMFFLMHSTGVYSLNNKKDIWTLCYRIYVIYGARLSFDELFLNELFFGANYAVYDPEDDFDSFALDTYENGFVALINTDELKNYIGLTIKDKVNADNRKFEKKLLLKAKRFWFLRTEHTVLFPITLRDPELRTKLLKGGKVGKKIKKQAAIWADLVTKYI